jgi:beta-lactamase class A
MFSTRAGDQRLRQQITALVAALSLPPAPGREAGMLSVWYGAVDGTPAFRRDERAEHYAASTMKLPLLVAAYRRHERGEIDLDRDVEVHNSFTSAADGSPFSLDQDDDQDDDTWARLGGTASLRWLARQSVVRSGNLATNLLLERVGAGEVADVLLAAGCSTDTVLPRGIGDARARDCGLDNVVTAADLALVIGGVADGRVAGAGTCELVEEVLAGQEHRDGIPAGVPSGTYVANKTGWVDGVTHDVALVRPAGVPPYVLAVCTTMDLPHDDANELIARVSRAVWKEHVA